MRKSELMQSSYGESGALPELHEPRSAFSRSFLYVKTNNLGVTVLEVTMACVAIVIFFMSFPSYFGAIAFFVWIMAKLYLRRDEVLALTDGERTFAEVKLKEVGLHFVSKNLPITYLDKPVEVDLGGIRPVVTWGGERVIEARQPWKDSERAPLSIGGMKYQILAELFVSPEIAEKDILLLATRLGLELEVATVP